MGKEENLRTHYDTHQQRVQLHQQLISKPVAVVARNAMGWRNSRTSSY
ncbi:hypothetical protein C4K05_2402 [Pseudomonas chlororaphis subsp. aureofaciens]|uniref:Uncharacterized protein n=1 Tax=Pseudomonas chlororaphis subsp. aureofaciens TaxID=587851 RepID=A0AAD0ZHH7_9PSED|nr:hypothetical protein C4K08_2372 [Pseudomonas chlororaphis subsp. aureofaciens]AZE29084.1 hypothetical protein C4K07_2299 [Pseudomonas chlororaphis subsp. aureofaciens]AZE35386.1 hypothetical protein C4K06_2353 [Pseudomonas chlororaphis subsp. aureofaciens]AZE41742.1 hypothetical protein C4K05_2402 [Pseudomonas chlororaphis subsp. aureofaciens]